MLCKVRVTIPTALGVHGTCTVLNLRYLGVDSRVPHLLARQSALLMDTELKMRRAAQY